MADISRQQDIVIVALDKSYNALNGGTIDALSKTLLELIEREACPRLILDFSRTEYIGSRVLEVLFQVWKRIKDRGGRLVICQLSPFCAEVLHITHLDSIWEIEPTREQALARISSVEAV